MKCLKDNYYTVTNYTMVTIRKSGRLCKNCGRIATWYVDKRYILVDREIKVGKSYG